MMAPFGRGESMNAAGEHQCQVGIVPAFTSLTGTDRDKGSRPALLLCYPLGRKDPPAALAAGDLAGDMELLAITAPEEAGKDATESQAEWEGAEKTAAMPEAESLVGTGLGGKVMTPEGAAVIVVGASENPVAERVAEAFARAAERIALSEVAKVLQLAIAELKGKRKNMWIHCLEKADLKQRLGKLENKIRIYYKVSRTHPAHYRSLRKASAPGWAASDNKDGF